ncbi:MAG TPA: ScyD/ScyE family protein [Mycobacteriales bacterium]|nr:ScyD/ScyE family protein [Mycobacteriales bacterium]
MRRTVASALVAATVSVAGGLAPAAADAAPPGNPTLLVSELNNPRQLRLLGGRSLLVAEAGNGGEQCAQDLGCVGTSGSVGLVDNVWAATPTLQRPVTGLLSAATEDGGFAVGSNGVGARNLNLIYVAMANGVAPTLHAGAGRGSRNGTIAGKLLLASWHRQVQVAADISAVEEALDPDQAGIDSNPYAVLVLPDGNQLVADAAGNDILWVRGRHVGVFAVLPDHDGHQAVPTSLALGPDGLVYVGELNGENPDTARVWRLSRSGAVVDWVGGFTTITGVTVGANGTVYVSELFGGEQAIPGQVTALLRNGSRVHYPVPFPAGIAVDAARHVYVSAWSISDSDGVELGNGVTAPPGQIWRLTL